MSEYVEYGGMTDLQYKGMLIDQLKNWQDILESLPDISENIVVREKIERQIKIIEEKMRFRYLSRNMWKVREMRPSFHANIVIM